MRDWLDQRKAGRAKMPDLHEPTSVLRPSRATTVGEKLEKRRKQQAEGFKKQVSQTPQRSASGAGGLPPPVRPRSGAGSGWI